MNDGAILDRKALSAKFTAAAFYGFDAEIALLLENVDEFDVNTANAKDFLAVHLATQEGHGSFIAQLVACERVDLNTYDIQGNSPMIIAVGLGHACFDCR
jgi:ankyrin repeat protein